MSLNWLSQLKEKYYSSGNTVKDTHQSKEHPVVQCINDHIQSDRNLPFSIRHLHKRGFGIHLFRHYMHIPFSFMPWRYRKENYWIRIFPYIRKRIFFADLYDLNTNPLRIKLDARVDQFKHHPLEEGQQYKAIILEKTPQHMIVELGISFRWNRGSAVAFLSSSRCAYKTICTKKEGDVINVIFEGNNRYQKAIVRDAAFRPQTINRQMRQWLGKQMEVLVVKNNGKVKYKIEGKTNGVFVPNRKLYGVNLELVQKAINNLVHHEWINCKVVDIDENNQQVILHWEIKEVTKHMQFLKQ